MIEKENIPDGEEMQTINNPLVTDPENPKVFSMKKIGLLVVSMILIFSLFWQENELTTEFISAFFPAIFLVCLIGFLNVRQGSKIRVLNLDIILIFVVFTILNFISVFWSVYPAQSLWESSKLLIYLFILFLSSQYFEETTFAKITKLMMVSGCFEVLLSIYNFLLVKKAAFTLATYSGRAMGTFPGPNGYAIYLLMVFMLACGLLIQKNCQKETLAYFFLMSVIVCGIVLSASRGVWLCGIVSISFFLFSARKNLFEKALIICTVLLGILIAIIVINASFPNDTPALNDQQTGKIKPKTVIVDRIELPADKIKSVNSRTPIWQAAMEMIKAKPLTGYGFGTFQRMYGTFQKELKEYPHYAHNNYLQVFAETGVVSFVVFLLFTLYNLRLVCKTFKQRDPSGLGMSAAILAFTLHTAIDFDWNFFAITSFFFYILGSLYGRKVIQQREKTYEFTLSSWQKKTGLILLLFTGITIGTQLLSRYELESSYRMIRNKNISEAAKNAKIASMFMPIDPLPYKVLSNTSLLGNKPDTDTAIKYAQKAIAFDSYNAWNYNDLGQLLLYKKDYKYAVENFTKALKCNRSELDFYLNLGRALRLQGQSGKAEKVLTGGFSLRNTVPKYFFDQTKPEVKEKTIEIATELIKVYNQQDKKEKAIQIKKIVQLEYPDSLIKY